MKVPRPLSDQVITSFVPVSQVIHTQVLAHRSFQYCVSHEPLARCDSFSGWGTGLGPMQLWMADSAGETALHGVPAGGRLWRGHSVCATDQLTGGYGHQCSDAARFGGALLFYP